MPDCACKWSDARTCYAHRYPTIHETDLDEDSTCECACHQEDEDGFTEWQDEAERRAILEQREKDRLENVRKYGVG